MSTSQNEVLLAIFKQLEWLDYHVKVTTIVGVIIIGLLMSYFVFMFIKWFSGQFGAEAHEQYASEMRKLLGSEQPMIGHAQRHDMEEEEELGLMGALANKGRISPPSPDMTPIVVSDSELAMQGEDAEDYERRSREQLINQTYDAAICVVINKSRERYTPPQRVELSWKNDALDTYGLIVQVVYIHDKTTYEEFEFRVTERYHTSVSKDIWDSIESDEEDTFVTAFIHKEKNTMHIGGVLEMTLEEYQKETRDKYNAYIDAMYANPSAEEYEDEDEEEYKDDECTKKIDKGKEKIRDDEDEDNDQSLSD